MSAVVEKPRQAEAPREESVVWDPAKAYEAYVAAQAEARAYRDKSAGMRQSLDKMAGTAMVERTVVFTDQDDVRHDLSMPEYVGWLDAQAEAVVSAGIERFGGQKAVDACRGVSYAGEIPPMPSAAQEASFPTHP